VRGFQYALQALIHDSSLPTLIQAEDTLALRSSQVKTDPSKKVERAFEMKTRSRFSLASSDLRT